MPKTRKKDELRNKTITMRMTKDELECLKQKATEANISVSELTRRASLEKPVQHIYEGKRVAKQLGLLHEKLQVFHHDMANHVRQLQCAIQDSTALAKKSNGVCSPDMQEAFRFQKERIDAVAGMLMAVYSAYEQNIEEAAHNIISKMGKGVAS